MFLIASFYALFQLRRFGHFTGLSEAAAECPYRDEVKGKGDAMPIKGAGGVEAEENTNKSSKHQQQFGSE